MNTNLEIPTQTLHQQKNLNVVQEPSSNILINTKNNTDELDMVKTNINNIKQSIINLEKYFKKLEKDNLELQKKLSKKNNNNNNINSPSNINNKRKRKSTQISEISNPIIALVGVPFKIIWSFGVKS